MLKKFGAVCLAAVLLLTGCTLRPQENGSKVQSISRPAVESAELQFTHPAAGDTVAVFDTSAGVFRAVLFPDKAPQTYDNFAGLVQAGYYNGLTVSRSVAASTSAAHLFLCIIFTHAPYTLVTARHTVHKRFRG